MSFRVHDEQLLGRYKIILTKTEDLKKNELNALPVHDDRYIKTKIRAYGDNVYTNFGGLNELEDDIECKLFTVIESLLCYESKYCLQLYLENSAYKIVDTQMID